MKRRNGGIQFILNTSKKLFLGDVWKLGGLEFCLPIESWGNESFQSLSQLIDQEMIPPEFKVPIFFFYI